MNNQTATSDLTVRKPVSTDAEALAHLLSSDAQLKADLDLAVEFTATAEEFTRHVEEWCQKHDAVTFAIVVNGQATGTISLTRINHDSKDGGIGYWMGSEFRQKGYCSRAFAQVLNLAASLGLNSVSARIEKNNLPSQKIWQKYGAEGRVDGNRVRYTLDLPPNPNQL